MVSPVKDKKKKKDKPEAKAEPTLSQLQKALDFAVQPSTEPPKLNGPDWPLLLKDYDRLNVKTNRFFPTPSGSSPLKREIVEYIKNGYINLDKPSNLSSQQVAACIKRILGVGKTGHSGTVDHKATGCLIVCIDRAMRLIESQQSAGKVEYVAVFKLDSTVAVGVQKVTRDLEKLRDELFQRPPLESAARRHSQIRSTNECNLCHYDEKKKMGAFRVSCEAGTNIKTLCVNLGGQMLELRCVRSGVHSEMDDIVTMHDVLDAKWQHDNRKDEAYLRRVIRPLEGLLVTHKRIMMKNSSISAICYGAKVLIPGVLRYEDNIELNDEVVIMSVKGEAVALAVALMTTATIASCNYGIVAVLKRVIMEKQTYPRHTHEWGRGPRSTIKRMIRKGLLNKDGTPNEKTPKEWSRLRRKPHDKTVPPTEAKQKEEGSKKRRLSPETESVEEGVEGEAPKQKKKKAKLAESEASAAAEETTEALEGAEGEHQKKRKLPESEGTAATSAAIEETAATSAATEETAATSAATEETTEALEETEGEHKKEKKLSDSEGTSATSAATEETAATSASATEETAATSAATEETTEALEETEGEHKKEKKLSDSEGTSATSAATEETAATSTSATEETAATSAATEETTEALEETEGEHKKEKKLSDSERTSATSAATEETAATSASATEETAATEEATEALEETEGEHKEKKLPESEGTAATEETTEVLKDTTEGGSEI